MDKKTEAITLQSQSGVEAIASEPLFLDYTILAEAVLLDLDWFWNCRLFIRSNVLLLFSANWPIPGPEIGAVG